MRHRFKKCATALAALILGFQTGVAVGMDFPKHSKELTILSEGSRLPALLYGAAGEGPHPTVVLLHGYPGNEKSLDIAQGLRADGWNVVFFHYRGAWGAEGEFSFSGSEQDVTNVTQYLRTPEVAERLRIDPTRISYVGHSMGGHMAVAGILENPEVQCSVVYDGANMGVTLSRGDEVSRQGWLDYADSLFMLKGWSGEKSLQEVTEKGEQLNLVPRAHKIGQRPILFIPANSPVIPLAEVDEVVNAMRAVEGNRVSYQLIEDDHGFNNHREELLEVTKRFLDDNCR